MQEKYPERPIFDTVDPIIRMSVGTPLAAWFQSYKKKQKYTFGGLRNNSSSRRKAPYASFRKKGTPSVAYASTSAAATALCSFRNPHLRWMQRKLYRLMI